jgi:hypothetical protein
MADSVRRNAPARFSARGFRPYEIAVLLGFMIVPLVAISTAVLLTGMFVFRYALIVIFGASLLISFAAAKGDRAVPFAGCLLFLAFFLHFVAFQLSLFSRADVNNSVPALIAEVPEGSLPIVMAEPINYLEVVYRAPPGMAARLYYVADADLAKKYAGSASADRGLVILKKGRPLNVSTYGEFIAGHHEFLVYSNPGNNEANFEWLLAKLVDDNQRVYLRRVSGRESLYEVTLQMSAARP